VNVRYEDAGLYVFLALLAEMGLSLIFYIFACARLRNCHFLVWQSLGKPSLVNSGSGKWRENLGFLYFGRFLKLHDPLLSALMFARITADGLFAVCFLSFSVLVNLKSAASPP